MTVNAAVADYFSRGGRVTVGNARKAIGSKTFRGRYSMTVSGCGRKATGLRSRGYSKSNSPG